MGNEPAGHRHAQLHPPFAAAAADAALLFLPPEPATTVTAEEAAVVVEAAIRASGVRVAELTEAPALEDVAWAVPFFAPPPATTVTAPAGLLELDFEPEPATTVTAAAPAPPVERVELIATTVTAAAAPLADLVELVPLPAWTVTGLPAGVTVGEAMRASGVSFAASTGDAAGDDVFAAAWTPGGGEPPATTVTAMPEAVALAAGGETPSFGFGAPSAGFGASAGGLAASAAGVAFPPSAISVMVPGGGGAEGCVSCQHKYHKGTSDIPLHPCPRQVE